MSRRMSLAGYLSAEETNRPQELAFGLLHEPPAPGFDHQIIVGRIHVALDRHVRRYRLGDVVESPLDVILDRRRALVVQPDAVSISTDRREIGPGRIWGAPALVVEVLSTFRRRHDQVTKVQCTGSTGSASAGLSIPLPGRSKYWTSRHREHGRSQGCSLYGPGCSRGCG